MSASIVGNRYAKALFIQAADDVDQLGQIEDALHIASTVFSHRDGRKILASAVAPKQLKLELLGAVIDAFGSRSKLLDSFFECLISAGRAAQLPAVAQAFSIHVDEATKRVRAQIVSAVKLGDADLDDIRNAIGRKFGRDTVHLQQNVDPSLLAGFTVNVGNYILDATLRTQVHAITAGILE